MRRLEDRTAVADIRRRCHSHPAGEPGSEEFGKVIEADPSGPFAAKVFKVVSDPYVGRMSYLRCMRGGLKKDESFVIARDGKACKVARSAVIFAALARSAFKLPSTSLS